MCLRQKQIMLPRLIKDFIVINGNELPYLLAKPNIAKLSVGFAFN